MRGNDHYSYERCLSLDSCLPLREHYTVSDLYCEVGSGTAVWQRNLAGIITVDETDELLLWPSPIGLNKGQAVGPLCEGQRQPLPRHEISHHRGRNIRGDIAVVVQMHHLADDRPPKALWLGIWQPHQVGEPRTKSGWLYAACQVGRHGTKEVASMKRGGYLRPNTPIASAYRQPAALHAR